jgi:hypothetical protein
MVLVLSSGNVSQDTAIQNALIAEGHTPTLGPAYNLFTGAELTGSIDSVLFQANANYNAGDMPALGQNALKTFVENGGGLVTGEWVVWKTSVAGGQRFSTLAPILPVAPTNTFSGAISFPNVTYTQNVADAILNNAVPSSFVFQVDTYDGAEHLVIPKAGSNVYYDSSAPNRSGDWKGVVGWDVMAGRVIHFSTVMGPLELGNANYSQLLGNAITWAGAAVPEVSSMILVGLGIATMGGISYRRKFSAPNIEGPQV